MKSRRHCIKRIYGGYRILGIEYKKYSDVGKAYFNKNTALKKTNNNIKTSDGFCGDVYQIAKKNVPANALNKKEMKIKIEA